MASQATPALPSRDQTGPAIDRAMFVRVDHVRADGFVVFDFAIGEPEIYVEMMLPEAAFEAFCAANAVIRLNQSTTETSDFDWRLSDAARDAAAPSDRSSRSN